MSLPDPAVEIRMTTLQSLAGANFWSQRPVTRMDLVVGAYDEISSAQAPGFTERLRAAMPGLIEHRCSIGERGGFLTRLRHGTYAPHIIEHVALELQAMAGHDVGYGKTRGGDVPGEYTLVFEHRHAGVGKRAAALALEVVQSGFSGTLASVDHATSELQSIAATPDTPPMWHHVLAGISGGSGRSETREELVRRGIASDALIVDVAPSYILQAGLPYSRSELAIILDTDITDVPERYREPERAQKLVSVLCDVVWRGGLVVVPAKEWEVQDYAREQGCRVAVFATNEDLTAKDRKVAVAAASVVEGRILIDALDDTREAGAVRDNLPVSAQVAAALAVHVMQAEGVSAT